jgi:glycosyltransferase involved in cell wall biosynthesis
MSLRVAVVHDWMSQKGGGELCMAEFLHLFPQADLYCIVDFLPDEDRFILGDHRVHTSFIQRLPFARKRYRGYLPLMPIAIEQFDLSGYDLVISTTSAVSKGVLTGPDQLHVSYTFSPIRYAWDLQHTYLAEAGLTRGLKGMLTRMILHYMRIWDLRSAAGVDRFVAISHFIARRIDKVYHRPATVIHAPVNLDRFALRVDKEDFYVATSRLVPYKRMPLIAEAFRLLPDRRLVVIGDGPEMPALKAAAGPNVTVMGRQPDTVVVDHLQRARAFIFAAEEDFGIVPLEAQACGTPVIAYGKGGALETIRGRPGEGQSGLFFDRQTPEAIADAVRRLDAVGAAITPEACRANAERFSPERFRSAMRAFIDEALAEHAAGREAGRA